MKSSEFKAVIDQIERAFSNVTLEAGVSLHEADVIDDYGSDDERKKARAGDEKEDWQHISEEDIARYQHVLCFMDAEGLRFHWPAWMVFTLRRYKTSDSLSTDSVIYSICRSAADHNTRALLSEEQRNAIIGFLEACLDLGDWLDVDQIPDALEAWRGDTKARRKLRRKLDFEDAVNEQYMKLVSEDSFLSDPDTIRNAATSELNPEQQHQFMQKMMDLRQKATQTIAEKINNSGNESLCYGNGQEIHVGDNVRFAVGQDIKLQAGQVVAVAGQNCGAGESVPVPEWGFFVEDQHGELIHWDEADEDLEFVNRSTAAEESTDGRQSEAEDA